MWANATDALLNGNTPEYALKNIIVNPLIIDESFENDVMKPGTIATEDATTLLNTPVTSGPFYAYREVFALQLSNGSGRKYVVRMTEAYPSPGRIWTCCYNTDTSKWSGWSSVGGSSY